MLEEMNTRKRILGKSVSYGGCTMSISSLARGADRYDTVLKYYIGKKIVERLKDRKLNTDDMLEGGL